MWMYCLSELYIACSKNAPFICVFNMFVHANPLLLAVVLLLLLSFLYAACMCVSILFIFSSLLFDTLQKQSQLQQNNAKGMCARCIGKSISTIRASNIRIEKKIGERERRSRKRDGLKESKFWELYLVYAMWLSCALSMFVESRMRMCFRSQCYQFVIEGQSSSLAHKIHASHTLTCYNLDDDGMDWNGCGIPNQRRKKSAKSFWQNSNSAAREIQIEIVRERMKGKEFFFDEKATASFIMCVPVFLRQNHFEFSWFENFARDRFIIGYSQTSAHTHAHTYAPYWIIVLPNSCNVNAITSYFFIMRRRIYALKYEWMWERTKNIFWTI